MHQVLSPRELGTRAEVSHLLVTKVQGKASVEWGGDD